MNFRRSKQSKPKRSANTSLYVAHHSSFATSCHNGGETKEFAFAKLEKFLITAKEKAEKILPRLDFFMQKHVPHAKKAYCITPLFRRYRRDGQPSHREDTDILHGTVVAVRLAPLYAVDGV